jgi:hypothetical protein
MKVKALVLRFDNSLGVGVLAVDLKDHLPSSRPRSKKNREFVARIPFCRSDLDENYKQPMPGDKIKIEIYLIFECEGRISKINILPPIELLSRTENPIELDIAT